MTRRYTNTRLPLPLPLPMSLFCYINILTACDVHIVISDKDCKAMSQMMRSQGQLNDTVSVWCVVSTLIAQE